MVVLSLPSSVEDSEGSISHSVVVGPSETLVFVAPKLCDQRKEKINTSLRSFASSLVPIQSLSDVEIGMKNEVAYDELFEFPLEMAEFSVFACVCPVFMPSIDQPLDVGQSGVVIGCVKGRLLVEIDGALTDLRSVLSDKSSTLKQIRNRGLRESTSANEHHAKPSALFRQTAFKEFHVGRMPSKLRVRFEKDRSSKTFW
ncbi:unnamed protein product, partial [Toxocara canis]|uniref:Uncharacterized protein n=1 Tax=Toxocara canis TaxID=6265 RepID=A0A183TYJ7_TOXCA